MLIWACFNYGSYSSKTISACSEARQHVLVNTSVLFRGRYIEVPDRGNYHPFDHAFRIQVPLLHLRAACMVPSQRSCHAATGVGLLYVLLFASPMVAMSCIAVSQMRGEEERVWSVGTRRRGQRHRVRSRRRKGLLRLFEQSRSKLGKARSFSATGAEYETLSL